MKMYHFEHFLKRKYQTKENRTVSVFAFLLLF